MNKKASEVIVTGTVQGVGFRFFCKQEAQKLNLFGWVKNLSDGSVISLVEGDQEPIQLYFSLLQKGSPNSIVAHTKLNWVTYTGNYQTFEITY